jgi:hypothetical protein
MAWKPPLLGVTLALTGLCAQFLTPAQARGAEVSEPELKAAFIYNFAKFTEWPESEEELRLCLLDAAHLITAGEALDGKSLGTQRLKVRKLNSMQEVAHCQILFVGEGRRDDLPRILKQLQNVPTLTVTDAEGLVELGVMIGMSRDDDRILFEVNVAAARRAGLQISAKLLSLARRVY